MTEEKNGFFYIRAQTFRINQLNGSINEKYSITISNVDPRLTSSATNYIIYLFSNELKKELFFFYVDGVRGVYDTSSCGKLT